MTVNSRTGKDQAGTTSAAAKGGMAIYINSAAMGRGDDSLGEKLMAVYIDTLSNFATDISHVILVNSGVKLACQGSSALEQLENLAGTGIMVLSCGTCLNYFALQDKLVVGSVSNMFEIIETMKTCTKTLSP